MKENANPKAPNFQVDISDLEKLEKTLLNELKEEIRKGITLKPSDSITAGLVISYDSGKSYYDFTDEALANYISVHLKPKLRDMLENSTSKSKNLERNA